MLDFGIPLATEFPGEQSERVEVVENRREVAGEPGALCHLISLPSSAALRGAIAETARPRRKFRRIAGARAVPARSGPDRSGTSGSTRHPASCGAAATGDRSRSASVGLRRAVTSAPLHLLLEHAAFGAQRARNYFCDPAASAERGSPRGSKRRPGIPSAFAAVMRRLIPQPPPFCEILASRSFQPCRSLALTLS